MVFLRLVFRSLSLSLSLSVIVFLFPCVFPCLSISHCLCFSQSFSLSHSLTADRQAEILLRASSSLSAPWLHRPPNPPPDMFFLPYERCLSGGCSPVVWGAFWLEFFRMVTVVVVNLLWICSCVQFWVLGRSLQPLLVIREIADKYVLSSEACDVSFLSNYSSQVLCRAVSRSRFYHRLNSIPDRGAHRCAQDKCHDRMSFPTLLLALSFSSLIIYFNLRGIIHKQNSNQIKPLGLNNKHFNLVLVLWFYFILL